MGEKKEKKVLFAVGGTGGHLFPAVALAKNLKESDPSISVLFAGGGVKNPKLLQDYGLEYEIIKCAGLSFRKPVRSILNLITILRGMRESENLFRIFKPSLVVGFGSFYTLPLLMAAKRMKIPYVLHEQNTIPGRVIRLFSKGAEFTAIHFESTQNQVKGKSCQVSMPLRWKFNVSENFKENAKKHFALNEKDPVVLVFGGSQGARSINSAMLEGIKKKRSVPFQILHFTGSAAESAKAKLAYDSAGIKFCVKNFEERMDLAWQAADFAVTRSGAVSMAEQIEFGVPGVLIPYPQAMDNHQESNADFFVNVVGGGIKYLEAQRHKGEDLLGIIESLINKGELDRLKQNISWYKARKKSADMESEILKLIS